MVEDSGVKTVYGISSYIVSDGIRAYKSHHAMPCHAMLSYSILCYLWLLLFQRLKKNKKANLHIPSSFIFLFCPAHSFFLSLLPSLFAFGWTIKSVIKEGEPLITRLDGN